jgi:hypothetical protein
MQIMIAIESFFESLGTLGLFMYSIQETISLFPISAIILLYPPLQMMTQLEKDMVQYLRNKL